MKRGLLIVLWVFAVTLVCSAQVRFYYPHIADGVQAGTNTVWRTTILLTNPTGAGTASGTITFTKTNDDLEGAGTVFSSIAFTDETGATAGSGGTITFSIPPGQTRKYTSTGTGEFADGFATVVTTAGVVTGAAIFSEYDGTGTRLIAEAGVPSASAEQNQAIFVDTIGEFKIGVAYANPGAAGASIALSLLNSSAATVATTTRLLGPGNHTAAFSHVMFPNAGPLAGTMQLRSSTPLAAIALRFDPTFSVFTTLPPVTLASLINPVMNWFDQRPWLAPLTSIAKFLGTFQLGLRRS